MNKDYLLTYLLTYHVYATDRQIIHMTLAAGREPRR